MEKKPLLGKWGATVSQHAAAATVPTGPNCYGWRAVNKGDSTAIVNNNEIKGYPPGHAEFEGASVGDMHPLAWPLNQEYITIAFKDDGSVNKVQLTYFTNY
jgi:hypothetical protein